MTTQKENSISARIQRRKPVIGEKSSGGKMITIVYTDFLLYPSVDLSFTHEVYTGSNECVNLIREHKPSVSLIDPLVQEKGFHETVIFYHNKKDKLPRKKTLKNSGSYFSDNFQRRKSSKGEMKRRIIIDDY